MRSPEGRGRGGGGRMGGGGQDARIGFGWRGGIMICYMLSFLKQGLRLQRYHVIPFLDVLNLNFTKLLSSNSFLYFKKSSSDLNVCLMQG